MTAVRAVEGDLDNLHKALLALHVRAIRQPETLVPYTDMLADGQRSLMLIMTRLTGGA